MEQEEANLEQPSNKIESLHKVTSFSKYLAMALFVALPFLGGWVGYTYAPEKIVEVAKIVEIEVQKKQAEKVEKNSQYTLQNFNTTYGGSRFGEVGISNDNSKKYLMQLPYTESVCCEYLHYVQLSNPDNGFNTIEEFYSLEEAGLLYQRKWPVSADNKYLAVSTFNDDALLFCDQGMGLDNKRVNNVLNVVDMDTATVKKIFVHEYEAVDFILKEFTSDGSEVIVEQTMYPVNEEMNCADNNLPGDSRTVSYPLSLSS